MPDKFTRSNWGEFVPAEEGFDPRVSGDLQQGFEEQQPKDDDDTNSAASLIPPELTAFLVEQSADLPDSAQASLLERLSGIYTSVQDSILAMEEESDLATPASQPESARREEGTEAQGETQGNRFLAQTQMSRSSNTEINRSSYSCPVGNFAVQLVQHFQQPMRRASFIVAGRRAWHLQVADCSVHRRARLVLLAGEGRRHHWSFSGC